MLNPMQGDHALVRMLWPALVLAVLAFVVVDFVRHPFLGAASEAASAPRPHLTLWLAETDASGEAGPVVHEIADSLQLYGRPATVGLLSSGASQAVTGFLGQRRPADQLLAVSSETLADLAQERTSALPGEDPLRAALAQRLLARAAPVGVLESEPLTIAVPQSSSLGNVGELLAQVRRSAQAHVFAITDDNWATDNLASLVQDAGVDGVVPYRVYPSAQDASLALTAGDANVVLAPRGALSHSIGSHQLRALAWPAGDLPTRSWVVLLAAPGASAAQIATLRRQFRALTHAPAWRSAARELGLSATTPLAGTRLRDFLAVQLARTAELQLVALQVERH
jgi:hypothetical protein